MTRLRRAFLPDLLPPEASGSSIGLWSRGKGTMVLRDGVPSGVGTDDGVICTHEYA